MTLAIIATYLADGFLLKASKHIAKAIIGFSQRNARIVQSRRANCCYTVGSHGSFSCIGNRASPTLVAGNGRYGGQVVGLSTVIAIDAK